MAIEINSKSKYYKSFFSSTNILGIVCLITVLIILGAYLFLSFTVNKMNKSIIEKETESFALTQSIIEKELEIIPVSDKINNFRELIAKHKVPINVFTIIEKNAFPNVQFTSLEFDLLGRTAILFGHTDDLVTVEQQFSSIKQEPLLSEVTLSGVSFSANNEDGKKVILSEEIKKGVDFNLKLVFKPEVFDK